jgi:hypothetical protein
MRDHPSPGMSAWMISGGPASREGRRAIAALKCSVRTCAALASASRNFDQEVRVWVGAAGPLEAEVPRLRPGRLGELRDQSRELVGEFVPHGMLHDDEDQMTLSKLRADSVRG